MNPEQAERHRSLWRQVLIENVLADGPAEAARWLGTPDGRWVANAAGFEADFLISRLCAQPRASVPTNRRQLEARVVKLFPALSGQIARSRRYRRKQKERENERATSH